MAIRGRTKIELRSLRGDVFPPGTEVVIIEEAHADGALAYFIKIPIMDRQNLIRVRYANFIVKKQDLKVI